MRSVPTSLYTLFRHFYILWGIYAPVGGWYLPGPLPTLVVNTIFLKMASGVGVWGLLFWPYVLFGVSGMMVWSLLAAPNLEVFGSYFSFVPLFWSEFQLSQVWFLCNFSLEDVCQFFKCIKFFCAYGYKRGGWWWIFQCADQLCCRTDGCIGGVNTWRNGVLRKECPCVCNTLFSCVGNVEFITPLVINCRSYVTALYPVMYPCAPSVGFSWTMTLVPGGAKDVLLESNFPSVIACAEIFWLRLEGLSMFNVICVWSRSLFHRCIVNSLSVPLIPEKKLVYVLISLSAAFLLCISGGANW